MRKIVVLVLLFVCIAFYNIAPSLAQERIVGVGPSSWFRYGDITVTWSSNDPNASKVWYGMNLEEYNETEWYTVEIEEVVGTNITIGSTGHFKNRSDVTYGGYIDVDTGDGVNATMMVISAGLSEGDSLYTAGDYSNWKINETIIRTYPDSTRETNHINFTHGPIEYTMPPNISCYYFFSMHFYWDKATGIMVEDYFEMTNRTGEYLTTWSMDFKINESNVWVVPEFPSALILPLFMIITLLIIVLKKKKLLDKANLKVSP